MALTQARRWFYRRSARVARRPALKPPLKFAELFISTRSEPFYRLLLLSRFPLRKGLKSQTFPIFFSSSSSSFFSLPLPFFFHLPSFLLYVIWLKEFLSFSSPPHAFAFCGNQHKCLIYLMHPASITVDVSGFEYFFISSNQTKILVFVSLTSFLQIDETRVYTDIPVKIFILGCSNLFIAIISSL